MDALGSDPVWTCRCSWPEPSSWTSSRPGLLPARPWAPVGPGLGGHHAVGEEATPRVSESAGCPRRLRVEPRVTHLRPAGTISGQALLRSRDAVGARRQHPQGTYCGEAVRHQAECRRRPCGQHRTVPDLALQGTARLLRGNMPWARTETAHCPSLTPLPSVARVLQRQRLSGRAQELFAATSDRPGDLAADPGA